MRFYILYLRPALAHEGEFSTSEWILWRACPNEGLQTGEEATALIQKSGIDNGYFRIVQSMAMVSPRASEKGERKVYFIPEE